MKACVERMLTVIFQTNAYETPSHMVQGSEGAEEKETKMSDYIVQTTAGRVQGHEENGQIAFLGIPYAKLRQENCA